MIRAVGDRLEVVQPMTLAHAAGLLEEGRRMLTREETLIDLGRVETLDSSALAVIFGWSRHSAAAGRRIRIVNAPANLLSLAELYGVAELLPV
ncbi:MAG: STAS domain-containing protein [Rhodocyclaceae bacterium]